MNRLTRRLATTVGLAAVTLVALAVPAAAHTEADAEAGAAGRTRITFSVAAECADGADPTNALRVQLPQGATDVVPEDQAGWTSTVNATELAWSAPAPTIDQKTFTVEMVLAEPVGSTVYLPTIQGCPGGEEIAWIQIPTSAGEQLQHPAPSIVVPANTTATTAAAAAATTSTEAGPTTTARMAIEDTPVTQSGSETNTAGLVVFIVVVVVIVGGAAILYLRYRRTGNTTPR